MAGGLAALRALWDGVPLGQMWGLPPLVRLCPRVGGVKEAGMERERERMMERGKERGREGERERKRGREGRREREEEREGGEEGERERRWRNNQR